MTELLDKEILDVKVGETTIREMGAIAFCHWITKKLDGTPTYRAATQELLMFASHPPMVRFLPEDEKIRYVRKLQALDIPIP